VGGVRVKHSRKIRGEVRGEERSGGCNLMPEFNRLVSAYI